MKLQLEDVLACVDSTDEEMALWKLNAKTWEDMWLLKAGFGMTPAESIAQQGREQVTTPDPYMTVNLAMRLINSKPKIMVPPRDGKDASTDLAERMERFLAGAWERANAAQQRVILDDAKWFALVRGSCVMQALWVHDILPKKLRGSAFPILIRALDPLNCYVKHGQLYTEWAFHRYDADIVSVSQRWPDIKDWPQIMDKSGPRGRQAGKKNLKRTVQVTDFWYMDNDGNVWNCVLVENRFVKEPKIEKAYPQIPFVECYGDSAPLASETARRLSILASMSETWPYKCRLLSNMGTAVLYNAWPATVWTSVGGAEIPDVQLRPGANIPVPDGVTFKPYTPEFNMAVAKGMLEDIEKSIQQASFPAIAYGDAGALQAGYSVNALTNTAAGRVKSVRQYLELGVAKINEQVLALVEANADSKGIELFGYSDATNRMYTEKLTPKEIDGYYRNQVDLESPIPQDDNARIMMGKQLADSGLISHRTLLADFMPTEIPKDEQSFIWTEQFLHDKEMEERVKLGNATLVYPDNWQELVIGTRFEQIAKDMGIWDEEAVADLRMRIKEIKAMEAIQGSAVEGPTGGPAGPPSGPMGAPLGGPPLPQGGPPPGPPLGPPSGPPPPAIPMPQGGGIPPELNNQITPEMLNMMRQQNPLLFQQIIGRSLSPADQQDLMGQGQNPILP